MADSNPKSGGPTPVVRSVVSNAKFDVEKFDGRNNFGMWQCEVMDVLAQQELDVTLEDKPEEMFEADWKCNGKVENIRQGGELLNSWLIFSQQMEKQSWNCLVLVNKWRSKVGIVLY
jgi:hypothetical protein